jgi:diguanylate cyclase (GGDEF)-like protein
MSSHARRAGGQEDARLRGNLDPVRLAVDLVSAIAGDRALTEAEAARVRELRSQRGKAFFSDLLYALSHHYFAPEIAEGLWNHVLSNRHMMSERLGRNVRVAVAALDYLTNIRAELGPLTLMPETRVAEIVELSMRDGMTGLFNHTVFYELLDLELRNHGRHGVGVALILLDIDDFKSVNDTWGHQEGDRILTELAEILEQSTRDSDICCRFGGEEFAVIMPYTSDPREALAIGERIRTGTLRCVSHGRAMTLSAGVAVSDRITQSSYDLVERADRALYQAKRTGKNRVVASEPPPG